MVGSYFLAVLLNVVPCPKSVPLLEDWVGVPKLLLIFTTWPLDNLLLFVQNFMAFRRFPVNVFHCVVFYFAQFLRHRLGVRRDTEMITYLFNPVFDHLLVIKLVGKWSSGFSPSYVRRRACW